MRGTPCPGEDSVSAAQSRAHGHLRPLFPALCGAGGLYPEQAFPDFAQRITPRSAPERYDSLTRAHQDYDYWGNPALSAYDVVFKGITAIDIVSDTDYDAQHPAGTSLKDIFTLTIQEVVKGAADGIPAYVFKETVYDPSSDFPAEVVKSRLLKLDAEHIHFVLKCLHENTSKIKNIKQYLLATLYNAPLTINSYYSALIRHDLAEPAGKETVKGVVPMLAE